MKKHDRHTQYVDPWTLDDIHTAFKAFPDPKLLQSEGNIINVKKELAHLKYGLHIECTVHFTARLRACCAAADKVGL